MQDTQSVKRQAVNSLLPQGWPLEVALALGLSTDYVREVTRAERNNDDVVELARLYITDRPAYHHEMARLTKNRQRMGPEEHDGHYPTTSLAAAI